MHVFPQLRKLEQKYQRELVVVGVHSPKFTAERDTEAVKQAVARNRVQHPVVNDSAHVVWQSYAVRAWPTLMFIDPQGQVIGKHEGEIPFVAADRLIAAMVAEFDRRGLLDRDKVLTAPTGPPPTGPLAFPGKVLADEASGLLYVADTGHHRIVVARPDGAVEQVIGRGQPGLMDGDFAQARFQGPLGMALLDGALYVADTENHAVRRVDRGARRVDTVAGTGEQAAGAGGQAGPARQTRLSSPWDITAMGGVLFIAMAGSHQVWALDVERGRVGPFAGSGHENIVDGPSDDACFAQPTGIATDGESLYVADSETSALRRITMDGAPSVETLVGTGLFDFGDRDGIGEQALMQHVQGVAWHNGTLYLADTYNHRVKRLDPTMREVTRWLGNGQYGLANGPALQASFHEPGGLTALNGDLYVADTNNHALRAADFRTGTVRTLDLRGL